MTEEEFREGLDRWFGHEDFRAGQYEPIEACDCEYRLQEFLAGNYKLVYVAPNGWRPHRGAYLHARDGRDGDGDAL